MALHGSLDSFTIPDVLRLLASTSKTGYLALTGDRGNGGIWLDDGRLVGGRTDEVDGDAQLVDVLFELLRYEDGKFSFEEGRACASPEEPADVDAIVGAAETMIAEFRRLEEVVPSFDHVVMLVEELPGEKVELSQSLWCSVVAAGRCETVRSIGAELDLGDLDLMRAVRDLIEADLATLSEPADPAAEPLAESEAVSGADGPDTDEQVDGWNRSEPADSPLAASPFADASVADFADLNRSDEPVGSGGRFGNDPSEVLGADAAVLDALADDADATTGDSQWAPGLIDSVVGSDSELGPAGEIAGDPVALMEDTAPAADEMARHLANLSPEAAKAVAAVANASTDEEREAAMDALRDADVEPDSVADFLGLNDD